MLKIILNSVFKNMQRSFSATQKKLLFSFFVYFYATKMEDIIKQYMKDKQRSKKPNIYELIDLYHDELLDVNYKVDVVTFKELKANIVMKFKEVMEKGRVKDYVINKRDVDWDSLAKVFNNRKRKRKVTMQWKW